MMGMELHASCAARDGAGVLLLGPPGSGKSDLLLRLLDQGFALVADDRVIVENGVARARSGWEGVLEVRGVGIIRLGFARSAALRLAVMLSPGPATRLPLPSRLDELNLPVMELDPAWVSAAAKVRVAVDCLLGRVTALAGCIGR